LDIPDAPLLLIEQAFAPGRNYDNASLLARLERVIDTGPLCVIHTSGSTGTPKGVALNHRSTIDFMDWVFGRLALDGSEIIGSLSPFYFDIYTLEIFLCLAKGSTLVIIPDQLAAFPARLMEFMSVHAVSFIFWVPTIMVNIANQDLLATCKIAALNKVLFAGEVFPTKHLNYWRRYLSGAMFVNLYGPIEITVDMPPDEATGFITRVKGEFEGEGNPEFIPGRVEAQVQLVRLGRPADWAVEITEAERQVLKRLLDRERTARIVHGGLESLLTLSRDDVATLLGFLDRI
jgi:acyl-coenzyme A synthetase/AMP-(fatty) acid ligase